MSHGLSDEAIFRLQLDVKRLNAECRALRQRLGIPLDGRTVTAVVDNSVDTVDSNVDTAVDMEGGTRPAQLDRAAYKREWMAKKRAAEKIKTTATNITA